MITSPENSIMKITVSKEKALKLLKKEVGVFSRLFQKGFNIEGIRLVYKPYYLVKCYKQEKYIFEKPITKTLYILVDGISGIATVNQIMDENKLLQAPEYKGELVPVEIDADHAITKAKSKAFHIKIREKTRVTCEEHTRLIYKPIWLINIVTSLKKCLFAIDGVNGYVIQI